MTKQQIEEKIQALKEVMTQNPDNVQILVHCGDKILDFERQLEGVKEPIVYLPPQT